MTTSEDGERDDALRSGGGSPFQGVARHALIYGAGIILGRAISFLMLPIYLRMLTDDDYGVIALIEMTLDFIAIIAGGTLAAGVFRFFYKAESDRERDEVVATGFLLISVMYIVVGVGVFIAADSLSLLLFDSTDHRTLFRIASANLALGGLTIVPLSFARIRDRSTLFVMANLSRAVLSMVFNILFIVVLGMGVMGVFLGTLISSAVVAIFLTLWLVRNVPMSWSSGAARNLLRFGIPLVATSVGTFILTFSDRYFLKAVLDEGAVGRYNLGYQFGFILVVLGFTPVNLVWGPRRFQVVERADRDEVLSRGFLLTNVLLISVAVAISLFVKDFLYLAANPEFHPAAQVVPVILIAYILQSWGTVQDIGILVTERTRYIAISDFTAAAVAVVGYALLIPRFFGMGAAYATLLAFMVRYLMTYGFSQRFFPVHYNWRPVVVLVAWATAIALTGYLLPPMSPFLSIAIRSVMGGIFLAGVWYLPILTERDRGAAAGIVRSTVEHVRATLNRATG